MMGRFPDVVRGGLIIRHRMGAGYSRTLYTSPMVLAASSPYFGFRSECHLPIVSVTLNSHQVLFVAKRMRLLQMLISDSRAMGRALDVV